jgi:hypothetical protein
MILDRTVDPSRFNRSRVTCVVPVAPSYRALIQHLICRPLPSGIGYKFYIPGRETCGPSQRKCHAKKGDGDQTSKQFTRIGRNFVWHPIPIPTRQLPEIRPDLLQTERL